MSDKAIKTFRVNKKETFYKTINTEFFFVPSLPLEAKGLLGLCLARPDDWIINFSETQRHSSNGETSHRSAWKALERHGYFHRNRFRNEKGEFVHEYIIYEHPSLNPHFSGIVPEIKKRKNPDVKIKSGQPEDVQTPEPTRGNPPVETHARTSTSGNPPPENHDLLNINQPSTDLPITEEPKKNEPITEKEREKSSLSEEITFLNVHRKIIELMARYKLKYNEKESKETSAINWFMTEGHEAALIYELMENLIFIKDSELYRDDMKFWKPIPIKISSAKSYIDQIRATSEALRIPKKMSWDKPELKSRGPEDFEFFEDWIQDQKITPETKRLILSANSPEEYFDPESKNPKVLYAKSFYEAFKKAKGGACKFKRPAA
ncbi:hypothetical protein EHQ12_04160 [Leptospira gomenensis]|uniref:Helix-turn-helix domain-containing protein n=1 Tax=Leptospira gomenensis TaxID=2484974 RepID=A0A5F1YDQ0_9LEPT|nr:hypothetical protein [Leptospira gomenensis]TGK36191.1 hypothetical protein EHQ17_04560 [Leptospira gomenensis]TGK42770.1 hypothetical protein EHQ07_13935 [Leptospira gomenensis]TGK42959.1 hypothetical protein EHQ12_04160 [Leptospira gomenensis]TGK54970.1 hypothetical protein EHQ13_18415 [Leptospira gomenensis]